ncbi:hypothetical protein F511_11345 [Dorcoceras hygrometricum]|uniref:Uncharacterized protein n=1 Tax=Dorcoceras hygrometricum TaxID=472368 RepID=A0A2Z7CMT8_9LAMI|nr:hypothetical protein F511_11345 [Dorcoceras hygrometricum]
MGTANTSRRPSGTSRAARCAPVAWLLRAHHGTHHSARRECITLFTTPMCAPSLHPSPPLRARRPPHMHASRTLSAMWAPFGIHHQCDGAVAVRWRCVTYGFARAALRVFGPILAVASFPTDRN